MSFPLSPTNGQIAVINNSNYVYSTVENSWTVIPGLIVSTTSQYDIAFFVSGTSINDETVCRFNFPLAATLKTTNNGEVTAGSATTNSTSYNLNKNGSIIGNVYFDAQSVSGTINVFSETSFSIGEVFTVVAPSPSDATLSDIGFTISFTRI